MTPIPHRIRRFGAATGSARTRPRRSCWHIPTSKSAPVRWGGVAVDNLGVPKGGQFTLADTGVHGNPEIERGATLLARGSRRW